VGVEANADGLGFFFTPRLVGFLITTNVCCGPNSGVPPIVGIGRKDPPGLTLPQLSQIMYRGLLWFPRKANPFFSGGGAPIWPPNANLAFFSFPFFFSLEFPLEGSFFLSWLFPLERICPFQFFIVISGCKSAPISFPPSPPTPTEGKSFFPIFGFPCWGRLPKDLPLFFFHPVGRFFIVK